MPYKDLETRKLYHREYYREYMKHQGSIYRENSEKVRSEKVAEWKRDLVLEYKFRRVQKVYGIEGLRAFERDGFSCAVCGEWDFRVLEMHEFCKPFKTASNLMTVCSNCHAKITFHNGENGKDFLRDETALDSHFMRVATYYGKYANCFSRKLGAVLVKEDSGILRVIGLGRNGPAIGVPHCNLRNPNGEEKCPRKLRDYKSGEGLEICPAVHAEANAIIFASNTEGSTLYGNFGLP